MGRLVKYITILLIALLLGLFSAWWGIFKIPAMASIKNGAWSVNPLIGSSENDMYSRSFLALKGLFALNPTETIYYSMFTDTAGNKLSTDCNYRLEGGDIETRWWSITIYGKDRFLIPNQLNRYAYSGKDLINESQSRYLINISSTEKSGNWLPAGNQGEFSLVLRVYNPSAEVYHNLGTIDLPKLIKEGCK